jgi:branched-chain amino acid aminotransferase
MNQWIHFNGTILPAHEKLVGAGNRGLRYGDGLFETMKVTNGTIRLFTGHMQRLQHGMAVLQMPVPVFFTPDYLQRQVLELCEKNGVLLSARVRLSVFRGNGTLYNVEDELPCILIEAENMRPGYDQFNEQGLQLGIYDKVRKSCDVLANLKSNNYLPYIMAAQYAKQHGLDDALLLNSHGRVCDATIANIFWIKEHVIATPALQEGGVRGIMRGWLVNEMQDTFYVINDKGYEMRETTLTIEELLQADEVFLTNALYGIRWVAQIQDKQYGNHISTELYNKLTQNKMW